MFGRKNVKKAYRYLLEWIFDSKCYFQYINDWEKDLKYILGCEKFLVYYQPVVNIGDNAIIGFEALVRGMKSSGKIIPPCDFIPLAEESGYIIPVGNWVLETACRQVKLWQYTFGMPMKVCVNISIKQLLENNFADIVIDIIDKTGLEAELLELEITESVAMEKIELVIATLKKLSKHGVKIALDDYGMGYSSLVYLRKLPIDIIKLDKGLIGSVTINERDRKIVKGMIDMAHSMKLVTTAEGVENSEQMTFLRDMDCDRAQGFLFSKPLPSEDIEKISMVVDSSYINYGP